jgi:hypothetical protein
MQGSIDWETWIGSFVPFSQVYCVDFYKGDNGGEYFSFTSANKRYVAWYKEKVGEPGSDEATNEPFSISEAMLGFIPSTDDVSKIKAFLAGIGVPINVHPFRPQGRHWKFKDPLDAVACFIVWVVYGVDSLISWMFRR